MTFSVGRTLIKLVLSADWSAVFWCVPTDMANADFLVWSVHGVGFGSLSLSLEMANHADTLA